MIRDAFKVAFFQKIIWFICKTITFFETKLNHEGTIFFYLSSLDYVVQRKDILLNAELTFLANQGRIQNSLLASVFKVRLLGRLTILISKHMS